MNSKRGSPVRSDSRAHSDEDAKGPATEVKRLPDDVIESLNVKWENTEQTNVMWEIIKDGDITQFISIIASNPEIVHIRSEDGRGPMWWAHEYGRPKMINILRNLGVKEDKKDVKGVKPTDITKSEIQGSI